MGLLRRDRSAVISQFNQILGWAKLARFIDIIEALREGGIAMNAPRNLAAPGIRC
jgi:hypothetical protein